MPKNCDNCFHQKRSELDDFVKCYQPDFSSCENFSKWKPSYKSLEASLKLACIALSGISEDGCPPEVCNKHHDCCQSCIDELMDYFRCMAVKMDG